MPGLGALWDSLVDCICRPPRDEYHYPDELVGGIRKLFRVGRCPGVREDLTLVNKRGLRLQCSHYLPKHVRGKDGRLPCVIYCHCNSGSRRDAEEAICVLIPHGVSVFTLDFAGSGLSDGQWVTLGAEEVDDVAAAVEHLRAGGRVSTLGLWGRSMGAVTALLYSQRDPSIAGMVLDSPFSRLTDLMLEIVQEQRLPIPRPLARLALAAMRRSVMKRAGFDITKVSPVDAVPQSFIPALFGHAIGDTFIRISHAEALHAAYAGDKNLIRFEGDHNSRRPEFFYNSVSIFWHNTLQLEHMLEPADLHPLFSSGAAAPPGGGNSGRGPVTPARALRPPLQQRARQPLAPSPAVTGTAVVPPPVGAEPLRSSSDAEAVPAAAAAATAQGGGGGDDDDGADVTVPGKSSRSAPWEPRLWEMELDKTLMERQGFRRMAGGLPSPPSGPSTAGGSAQRPGHFRNSAELAHLLANASDDSVVARLLGEDPPMSDAPLHGTAGAAAAAGGAGGGEAAAVGSAAAAAVMLLPSSEEEEEAQLRAALQLSLLELAAAGGSSGGGSSGAACRQQLSQPGQLPASEAQQPLLPPPPPPQSAAQQPTPPALALGKQPSQGLQGPHPQPGASGQPQPSPSLMLPTMMMGVPPAPGTAAAAAVLPLTGRSLSHEAARHSEVGLPAAVPPLGSLSGPQQSEHRSGPPQHEAKAGAAAAAGAAAVAREPAGGGISTVGGSGVAAAGPSVYDMYTEEELLALAVQLSLQESVAATAGGSGGGGSGAGLVGVATAGAVGDAKSPPTS